MKKIILLTLLSCSVILTAADQIIKNGSKPWSDRSYTVSGLSENLVFKNPVPEQKCSKYNIILPPGTRKALIAICANDSTPGMVKKYALQPFNSTMYIVNSSNPQILKYALFIAENPPEKIDCRPTRAGGILLALNDDVPALPSAAATASRILKNVPAPETLQGVKSFEGQEYRFLPGKRTVEYYVRAPQVGINANTGLMIVSHNWGGTWKYTAPWCDILSDRFNLICMSVNYLQSGKYDHKKAPYEHGVLQAMDCLRALYHVQKALDAAKIPFNRRRIYAAGASGGGNVSLMVNKLAPRTFGCIIDLCGMPGLTNDIAFGIGQLNAGYSRDPQSPYYLTPAMQEIRNPGCPAHLKLQKKWNPNNQVVIVHGLDDKSCNPADKMVIASEMVRAGFRPDTHFLTLNDVDGKIIKNTGHSIGNRPEIIAKFGGAYIAENGKFPALLAQPSDLDTADEVTYPVTGGKYIISFKGEPTIRFEKQ